MQFDHDVMLSKYYESNNIHEKLVNEISELTIKNKETEYFNSELAKCNEKLAKNNLKITLENDDMLSQNEHLIGENNDLTKSYKLCVCRI